MRALPIFASDRVSKSRAGYTLTETIFAAAVTGVILAAAAVGSVSLQKSFVGNKHYAAGSSNGSRTIDHISRDLRNASRVSRVDSGVTTIFKTGTLEISGTNQLVVFVPNYYVSNAPDNTSGSAYKTSRFSRSNLPTGQTYFPYDNVVQVVGITRLPNYGGLLEIRYVKKARSPEDPTVCYFRREFEGGVLRSEEDIAEKVDSEQLTVVAADPRVFRISTSFSPKWTGERARAGTRQFSTVTLLNRRSD
jgi:hypothetical protein